MQYGISILLSGISLGGQYALIAIGYTLVYGILRLINFAHGDVFMAAGLIMVYLSASLPLWVSVPLMLVLVVALGFFIERAAYKPLRSAPRMSAMISAIGVSYLLQNFATYITGGLPQMYPSIPGLSNQVTIAGVSTKWVTVITPVLVVVLVIALTQLINHTKIGMAMRAASRDFETAQLMGIKINSVISFTFIIGSFLAAICIGVILLLINSTYGRAFKAIRDDEVAAEAMGVNLSRHKRMAFCISSFFAGVGGGMFAMYANQAQAKTFTTAMTYEILLIVVIGGIGSISGSCIASFLYVAASEWWLRFLDTSVTFTSPADPRRIAFIAVYSIVIVGGAVLLILRERRGEKKLWKQIVTAVVAVLLMVWLGLYLAGGSMTMPFLRNGFRMVVFSLVIMVVVLFFRRGLMGDKELPDLFRRRRPAKAAKGGGAHG